MINICVLIKSIWDPVSLQWDFHQSRLNYLTYTFNKVDLHALQWACDYKRRNEAHIQVLLVIPKAVDLPLNRLKKFPIDEITIIEMNKENASEKQVASLLSEELKRNPFDLLLCGSRSEDADSGITPIIIAERLNLPCLTSIYDIETNGKEGWEARRKVGRGIVHSFQVKLPIVIGVERAISRLRYIPKSAVRTDKTMFSKKEAVLKEEALDYEIVKFSEPKPSIHYTDVPQDLLAQHRYLRVTGLIQGENSAEEEQIKSEVSEEHIHFVTKRIENWLKE